MKIKIKKILISASNHLYVKLVMEAAVTEKEKIETY